MAKFNKHLRFRLNRDEQSECVGKTRHESRGMAERELKRSNHRGMLNTYRCDHCGGFHIGHKPGSMTNMVAKKSINKLRHQIEVKERQESEYPY